VQFSRIGSKQFRISSDENMTDPTGFPNMPPDWQPWLVIAQNTYQHYQDHIKDVERWLAE